ncbi:hypothetical protein PPOP_0809, partial [Paenibacillus popilliae ATCC 14706]
GGRDRDEDKVENGLYAANYCKLAQRLFRREEGIGAIEGRKRKGKSNVF